MYDCIKRIGEGFEERPLGQGSPYVKPGSGECGLYMWFVHLLRPQASTFFELARFIAPQPPHNLPCFALLLQCTTPLMARHGGGMSWRATPGKYGSSPSLVPCVRSALGLVPLGGLRSSRRRAGRAGGASARGASARRCAEHLPGPLPPCSSSPGTYAHARVHAVTHARTRTHPAVWASSCTIEHSRASCS